MYCARDRCQTANTVTRRTYFCAESDSTAHIEKLIDELKARIHHHHRHPQYAAGGARVRLHRLCILGDLIEFGDTGTVFHQSKRKETEDYITGRFG
ncbi:MAG: hypothetical protein IPN81_11125 [Nitrosomonadales bacterium]|nr:hypothetical protein [Nitrosomonadales bacterium]